ncbi:NAD(P)/FAD-dependent oxidoreductase [Rudanella paleaurantiibacter]|uniref:NAD(P)/FAD-dependent oxidoreductase n=1 Tax=Rudanella paleaurantiibacter TaxID=2614655 RepID=A0A7J5TW28_9BACT|nr:NAD(P)/FAD-dependent oxidoreductase [Rudanella paleaurantiibacter]KAB7727342.1 NAD(P)/FAD-dependent oxidoreductase [Rudanella paleaurantiibacter]
MTTNKIYDVIIIGGSCAGLSAALVLGRSLREVLVIDAGRPCNRQTPHSHGFLTRDGESPTQLLAIAREQLTHYPNVTLRTGLVVKAEKQTEGFRVTTQPEATDAGEDFSARRLLLATGVFDIMPDLPGFAECWGRSVLHCPYCHGYEVHGQPLGVLANGEVGYEMATLIQHWAGHLTLFTNGPSTLTDTQKNVLGQLHIPIVETPIKAIAHQAGMLTHLLLADDSTKPLSAVFSRVPFRQHTNIAEQLGCELQENGLIKVGEVGDTSVPGVFAAGDTKTLYRQVTQAVAGGAKTGAWINRELLTASLQERIF